MNKLLVTLLVSIGISGFAYAEGDAVKGQAKAAVCASCHMPDGNSVAPTFPKLAGQKASYIAKQLKDIKGGVRTAPIMVPFAGMMATDEDRANVAAYFSSQTTKPGAKGDPALMAKGKEIFTAGILSKNVPACAACHAPNGEGNELAAYPRLKSQHAMYLETQLKAFRAGTRKNDPASMMRDIASKLSDDEIKAVATYLQGM